MSGFEHWAAAAGRRFRPRLSTVTLTYWAAGVFAAIGILLRAVPTRVETPQIPAAEPVSVPLESVTTEAAQALLSYQEVVRKNIFDLDREAPDPRYVPPELAAMGDTGVTKAVVRRGPRLFGLAVGPDGAIALIDADPTIPGAEVYRPGDIVAGLRLVEVTDTTAILAGTAGTIVLRLPVSRP
ncbi:MAG: hypothetical protein P8125_01415 [Gemmatimonadota bacterium]